MRKRICRNGHTVKWCGPHDDSTGEDVVDQYGDIRRDVAVQYFKEIEQYRYPAAQIDWKRDLPSRKREALAAYLATQEGYDSYLDNLRSGVYYVVEGDEERGWFHLEVPWIVNPAEGPMFWRYLLDLLVQFDGSDVRSAYGMASDAPAKLTAVGGHWMYVSVRSSLGGKYSKVRLLIFRQGDFSSPRFDRLVYSTGTLVPTIILRWTVENGTLLLTGFSDDNPENTLSAVNTSVRLD